MKSHIASIDVGTTNTKINLFNSDFELIDSYKSSYERINSNDQIFEMDFEEIWEIILDGLRTLTAKHEMNHLEIILTTAMHSVQYMDKDFNLIGSALTWADKRGARELEGMTQEDKASQYDRTGTPLHSMNPYFKLLATYQTGNLVGSLKDILFYRLTNEWSIDISNASSSGLLNRETLTWDEQSLGTIGLAADNLPQIRPVDYQAPLQVGLLEVEATVTIGTSDGVSSNYVFNDLDQAAVLSIGTSHAVRVVNHQPQLNLELQNFSYVIDPEHHLIGLPSNNGADVLSWVVRIFNASYEELDEVAGQRPETQSIFLPYLNGERAPLWDEFAMGQLYNLSRESSRESVLFSLILGMVFNIKDNVESLRSLVGFQSMGLVGGVTAMPAVTQLIADVLGYTLHIPMLANAETLGSVALVKGLTFDNSYMTVEPTQSQTLGELYQAYLKAKK